ncbi:MAG TPA: hypothetical protein VNS46_01170 [Nocardioides sp.]|nr:hypothetical protein [Nocardioides sp.]
MSEQRLHDLLGERVEDLEPVDLSGLAWRRAASVRHRRRVVAGVVLAVVALVGGVGVVVATDGAGRPARLPATTDGGGPAPTAASDGPVPTAERAGRQHGATVWWAPAKAAEADLPPLAVSGVPEEIDLAATVPAHPPGVAARAVFMVGAGDPPAPGRVVVLGTDGATYSLDARLRPVADEFGNAYLPLGEQSLAPDGKRVFFRQPGQLVLYDLTSGAWSRFDVPGGLSEGARWFSADQLWVPEVLGEEDGPGTVYDLAGRARRTDWRPYYDLWEAAGSETYGPQALDPVGIHLSGFGPAVAQAQFPDVELVAPDGVATGGTDVVVTRDRAFSKLSVLVLPYGGGEAGGRWKACCPVVGWLGGLQTLLFTSRGDQTRVLAWDVGTRRLWRVTRISGWEPGEETLAATWSEQSPG